MLGLDSVWLRWGQRPSGSMIVNQISDSWVTRYGLVLLLMTCGVGGEEPSKPLFSEQLPVLEAPFPVFDALLYRGKPTTVQLGLQPISVINAHAFWGPNQDRDEPIERQVRAAARWFPKDRIICLDVEHWSAKGPQVDQSIRKLKSILMWVRDERPDLVLGYYGVMPLRDYWRATREPADEQFKQWVAENRRLEELAQHVDVIFPSLYTFYVDEDGWQAYALANLKQARRYGKPVYAFLCPQFHDSNVKLKGQHLSGEYWAKQLRVCRMHADGVVIWGGWLQWWDDQAPWWWRTVRFLHEISH